MLKPRRLRERLRVSLTGSSTTSGFFFGVALGACFLAFNLSLNLGFFGLLIANELVDINVTGVTDALYYAIN